MTDRIEDGGAAYPRTGEGFGNPHYDTPGMSLRDYFAASVTVPEEMSLSWAMALLGRKPPEGKFGEDVAIHLKGVIEYWAEVSAAYRYLHADAMLAARTRQMGVNVAGAA